MECLSIEISAVNLLKRPAAMGRKSVKLFGCRSFPDTALSEQKNRTVSFGNSGNRKPYSLPDWGT
jgi:hypothetical protein